MFCFSGVANGQINFNWFPEASVEMILNEANLSMANWSEGLSRAVFEEAFIYYNLTAWLDEAHVFKTGPLGSIIEMNLHAKIAGIGASYEASAAGRSAV